MHRFLLERLLKYEKKKDTTVTKATGRSKPPVVQVSPRQQMLPKQQSLPRQPARAKPVVTPSRIPRQQSPDSDESLSDHIISPSPVVNLLPRKKPDRSLPKKIQAIPLKEDGKLIVTIVVIVTNNTTGSPVYPINLGGLQVINLGHVIHDRPSYHTERYILPVGYCSRRSYFSIKEPASRCMYTCKILDGGENPIVSVNLRVCMYTCMKLIGKCLRVNVTGPSKFDFSNES